MSFARSAFALACTACAAAAACNLTIDTDGLEGTNRGEAEDASVLPDASSADATTTLDATTSRDDAALDSSSDDAGDGQMDAGSIEPSDAASEAAPAVDPDLVGVWTFDEEAGAPWANNSSPNDPTNADKMYFANGAFVGGQGRTGGALQMPNGTSSAHAMALDSPAFPVTGTLSIWFQHATPDGSTTNVGFFDYGDNRTVLHFYSTYQSDNDYAFVLQGPGCSSSTYCGYSNAIGITPDSTSWTHLIWTWDFSKTTGSVTVYANPESTPNAISTASSGPDSGSFSMELILQGGAQNSFDDVKLYKRMLTMDEIIVLQ